MVSVPVGIQCLLTSSLGEFLGYWAGSGILGYRPCCVHRLSLRLPYLVVYPFTLLHLSLDFIRVSFIRPTYMYPTFTYSLFRGVSTLGTGSSTRCCSPRGGTGVCMEQKSRSKFLPWLG